MAYLSPNEVICIFETIHPGYFMAAVNVITGYDYLTQDTAALFWLKKLRLQQLNAPLRDHGIAPPPSKDQLTR